MANRSATGGLTLVTPPTEWPVTLAEAKAQCRVQSDDEDALLEGYIKAATRHIENSLGISIAEQTWRLTLDTFSDAIELPRGRVTEVTGVEYVDTDGLTQTLSTDIYTTDLAGHPQWLVLSPGASWPDLDDAVNAVNVTYTAGMETVPDDLKHAILLLIGHWYAQRETVNVGNIASELPFATSALIQPYRRVMV